MHPALKKILLLILGLALLGLLLYHFRSGMGGKTFSWQRFRAAVRHAKVSLLAVSIVVIYFCYLLRAARWVRFSHYLGPMSLRRVYEATVMGFTAIFLLGRAGEPVRPLLIARREKLGVSSMFGIYVIERVFDISATVVFSSLSLVFLPALLAEHGSGGGSFLSVLQKGGAVLMLGLFLAIVFLFYLRATEGGVVKRGVDGWRAQKGWRPRLAGLFAGFLEGLRAVRTMGDLAAAAGWSAAHWTLIVLIYHWVPASFGGQLAALDMRAAMVVLACTMLGSTVQVPGIGGGSQAASYLALHQLLGVDSEPALAAALMLWLVTFASCTIVGIPLLIHEGMSFGELRRIASAERAAEEAGTHIGEGNKPEGASR
jgi:uncharacterized protein (TIRG00374 family)